MNVGNFMWFKITVRAEIVFKPKELTVNLRLISTILNCFAN